MINVEQVIWDTAKTNTRLKQHIHLEQPKEIFIANVDNKVPEPIGVFLEKAVIAIPNNCLSIYQINIESPICVIVHEIKPSGGTLIKRSYKFKLTNEGMVFEQTLDAQWMNAIMTVEDLYKNPYNIHLWDTVNFRNSSNYISDSLFINDFSDYIYLKIENTWVPIEKSMIFQCLNRIPSKFHYEINLWKEVR